MGEAAVLGGGEVSGGAVLGGLTVILIVQYNVVPCSSWLI